MGGFLPFLLGLNEKKFEIAKKAIDVSIGLNEKGVTGSGDASRYGAPLLPKHTRSGALARPRPGDTGDTERSS